MKKIISILLCIAMVTSMAACGGSNNQTSATGGKATEKSTAAQSTSDPSQTETPVGSNEAASGNIDFNEDPYTLHICYAVGGEAQPDLPLIREKLNEITLKEINAKVELEAVSLFSLANVYALKASGQERMDLMILFPGSSYMTAFANSNLIMPMDDYVDTWGADLKSCLGEMIEAGRYKGHIYAIPQKNSIRKGANGFALSRTLCEKYDIKTEDIKSIEDLEAVFDLIKTNEPDVTVIMPEASGSSIAGAIADYYDTCGAGTGIVKEVDGKLTIVNQTEDEDFINACKKAQEWYDKGYLSRDILTSQEDGASALQAGKCFALAANSINANMGNAQAQAVLINTEPPMLTTADDQLMMWAVPTSCERPDKAVQFLNLCIGSEEIANLMMYGLEGTHYTVLENGTIDNSSNANWNNPWPMFGDGNKLKVRADEMASMTGVTTIEEYRDRLNAWPLTLSPAYGFNFDPEKVKTQIATCDAVNDEFRLVVSNGTVDVESQIKKWTDKLYDAGLDDVMKEKQAQLDAWVASQK